MIRKIGFLLITAAVFTMSPHASQAKIWLVGPDFKLKNPQAAIKLAKDGDTIKITSGLYEDSYITIYQNNLTIEGVNGMAHLKAITPIANRKAIWVTRGNKITIRNIEFSGATVADKNGAGIRLESGSLTLDNCIFHDNEMGVLTSNKSDMTLVIKNSHFYQNTQDYPVTGRLSHNIYVGKIALFQMENSISRGAKYGHNVKSRAQKTILSHNQIFDEGEISSSYLIDLPNGGVAIIDHNDLSKNNGSQNDALISYGAEGTSHSENKLTILNNAARNEGGVAFLLRNHSAIDAHMIKNDLTNITLSTIPGSEKDGLWNGIKNYFRKYLN